MVGVQSQRNPVRLLHELCRNQSAAQRVPDGNGRCDYGMGLKAELPILSKLGGLRDNNLQRRVLAGGIQSTRAGAIARGHNKWRSESRRTGSRRRDCSTVGRTEPAAITNCGYFRHT